MAKKKLLKRVKEHWPMTLEQRKREGKIAKIQQVRENR